MKRKLIAFLLLVVLAHPARAETATQALSGTTFQMADGQVIALAGLIAPASSMAALEKLIAGQNLTLHPLQPDRYRHTLATATLPDGRDVAAALLEIGAAQFFPETRADPSLLAAEEKARQQHIGLWQQPDTRILQAIETEKFTNNWRIVEGTIISTTSLGSTTFVNFGADWKTDFTVRMTNRLAQKLGPELKNGAKVRVRGWLAWRNGPEIEVTSPLQLTLFTE